MPTFKLIKKHKLDKLSVDDLKELSSELSEYVTLKEVEDAKQEFEAILKAKGLKPGDVYPGMTATPAKTKPATRKTTAKKTTKKKKDGRGSASEAPKYRNPETGETWSKGRVKNWVLALCEERGITKEDFMASAEFLNPEHPNYEEFKKAAEEK